MIGFLNLTVLRVIYPGIPLIFVLSLTARITPSLSPYCFDPCIATNNFWYLDKSTVSAEFQNREGEWKGDIPVVSNLYRRVAQIYILFSD
jgi:hypothetical protein